MKNQLLCDVMEGRLLFAGEWGRRCPSWSGQLAVPYCGDAGDSEQVVRESSSPT